MVASNGPLNRRVWRGKPCCESGSLDWLRVLLFGGGEVVRAMVGGRASRGGHRWMVSNGCLLLVSRSRKRVVS